MPATESDHRPSHYPPAPWRLSGTSIQTIRVVDANTARRTIPDGLRVVTVWPGKTLAVLYCAHYESPSVLQYHELILAPALVAAGGRVGFWISQIFVDDRLSQAGGRAIWGLPKELAAFDWDVKGREISVHSGAQLLCRLRWRADRFSVPMPLYLPAITRIAGRFQFFGGRGSASVARATANIVIPAGSLLEPGFGGFSGSRTAVTGQHLKLHVAAPSPLP